MGGATQGKRARSRAKRDESLITTSLRVERDLLDQFQARAKQNYRSGSAEMRRLMAEYVAAAENGEAA